MPTSSQAMILRCTDAVRSPAMVSYKCLKPFDKAILQYQDNDNYQSPVSVGRGERVKFDISVCADHDKTIDGFEGVFYYDENSKSFRWKVFTVSPTGRTEISKDNHESGDYSIEESRDSEACIIRQSSEYCGHYTTPSESVMDNVSEDVKSPGPADILDDATYRRLEELGFRRRTSYTPGGSFDHLNQKSPKTHKSPKRSSSELITSNCEVPKLSVRNLDREMVLKQKRTPKSSSQFPPQAFVCGDSLRRRVRPPKPKSLLEEVKETVNWANRVTPSSSYKHVPGRNLKNAVCFSLRDGWKYDHVQVKRLVEAQLRCEVKGLQYDPLSIRSSDGSVLDRWMVTLNSNRECSKAIEKGLYVDGDKVVVRSWDDIEREERGEDWDYLCNYRMSSAKHERALKKFLQVH